MIRDPGYFLALRLFLDLLRFDDDAPADAQRG